VIEPDLLEHRYLGAIRLLDARTRQSVDAPVSITGAGVTCFRNRSGLCVIKTAHGFESYNASFFEPPTPLPAAVKVRLAARDTSGRYLPREFNIDLPRTGADLLKTIDVDMYPATVLSPPPGVAVLYATAIDIDTAANAEPLGLPWALVDVLEKNGSLRVSTLADLRGEVVVAVPGIAKSSPAGGGGAVLANKTDFDIEVIFDPAVFEKLKANKKHMVNPDEMRAGKATLKRAIIPVSLGAGLRDTKTFGVKIT
jgi:hypothetical protein